MFIESAMAVRFAAGPNLRSSTTLPYSRPIWSSDDPNRVVHTASCRVSSPPYTGGYGTSWSRFRRVNSKSLRRNIIVKNGVQASAEHLDSASDPLKLNGKAAYHPSEDITGPKTEIRAEATLTAAESARTIIEVNSKATLMFSSVIDDEVHENVILPDLHYLTDEHGNIYFQVKKDADALQSIPSEDNFVQVFVGVDTMEMINEMELSGPSEIDFGIEEIDEDEDGNVEDDSDDDEDNDDYESEWVAVFEDDIELDDSNEPLEDWAEFEIVNSSSPIHFARKLAKVASDDPIDWMELPPASMVIQGIVRPAFMEEQSVIYNYLSSRLPSNANVSQPAKLMEDEGGRLDAINLHRDNSGSSEDDTTSAEKSDNHDLTINGTSFYRLEMVKIQLFSSHGHQTEVEVEDYAKAKPDTIVQSAAKIISQLKAGGEKTMQALKSLCWRHKGIQVEEAALTSVDSLGFDLRVCSGTQVQTLRFAFNKRATSEYSAERQLDDLLFPRTPQKVEKTKQTHQNEC